MVVVEVERMEVKKACVVCDLGVNAGLTVMGNLKVEPIATPIKVETNTTKNWTSVPDPSTSKPSPATKTVPAKKK